MFGIDESKVITFIPDGEPAGSVAVWETKAQFAAAVNKNRWSKAFVTAIWNANVGRAGFEEKMKKFRNRPYGVGRIWEAIQALKGEGKGQTAEPPATNGTPKRTRKPTAQPRAAKPTNGKPREGSRRDAVIQLLSRENGVTSKELQEAFGWKLDSARGFLSTLGSKHGVKIAATKDAERGRVYRAV